MINALAVLGCLWALFILIVIVVEAFTEICMVLFLALGFIYLGWSVVTVLAWIK